jgi:hypothetical protein
LYEQSDQARQCLKVSRLGNQQASPAELVSVAVPSRSIFCIELRIDNRIRPSGIQNQKASQKDGNVQSHPDYFGIPAIQLRFCRCFSRIFHGSPDAIRIAEYLSTNPFAVTPHCCTPYLQRLTGSLLIN